MAWIHNFKFWFALCITFTHSVENHGFDKRLLMDNPQDLNSRLHQMELTIQSLTEKVEGLTSQLSQKDSYVTQLQGTVIGLQTTVCINHKIIENIEF